MMVTVCILIGLGLLILGIIIACATKTRRNKDIVSPPPLPPRVNTDNLASRGSQHRTRTSNSIVPQTLPARQSSASATASAKRRLDEANCGPRGIKPTQFPCCPYDKQRNVLGGQQVIFWDNGSNCYRCSRGHQFKSNGKIL